MSHERRLEQAEIYAAGALDGVELAELEAHLAAGCPACEEVVTETREVLATLPLALPQQTPPLALRERVLAALDRADDDDEEDDAPFAVVARPKPAAFSVASPGRVAWLAAGASAIAAAGLLIALLLNVSARNAERVEQARAQQQLQDQLAELRSELGRRVEDLEEQRRVAEQQVSLVRTLTEGQQDMQGRLDELRDTMRLLEDPDVEVIALSGEHLDPKPNEAARAWLFWDAKDRSGIILARGLQPVSGTKVYELWGIAEGHAPVPMSCYFRPDKRGCAVGRVKIDSDLAFGSWAVSLEAEPGAKVPTMPLQLAKI